MSAPKKAKTVGIQLYVRIGRDIRNKKNCCSISISQNDFEPSSLILPQKHKTNQKLGKSKVRVEWNLEDEICSP